jgi:hypothetical protein
MAKIFGIEETELENLPDEIKSSLKAANADAEAKEARLAAIEAKLNGDGDDKNKKPPTNDKKWSDVDAGTEMLLQNRCDMILMRMLNDSDPFIATSVKLFEKEIRENLELSHPTARAQEPFVRNVIDMVKGRHMAEILADVNKNPNERKYGSFFVEGASGNHNNNAPQKSLTQRLSDEQRKAAKMFGIAEEDYAKELDSIGALGA